MLFTLLITVSKLYSYRQPQFVENCTTVLIQRPRTGAVRRWLNTWAVNKLKFTRWLPPPTVISNYHYQRTWASHVTWNRPICENGNRVKLVNLTFSRGWVMRSGWEKEKKGVRENTHFFVLWACVFRAITVTLVSINTRWDIFITKHNEHRDKWRWNSCLWMSLVMS